jgi:hypothetical protein
VRRFLERGEVGAAAVAFASIDAAMLSADAQAACRRLDFWFQVEVARAERSLAALEQFWPEAVDQLERLDAIATTMAGLPVAAAAEQRQKSVASDPKVRAEFEAQKELRELRPAFDEALASRSKSRRKRVADQLERFATKHAGTAAANHARHLQAQLRN